MNSSRPAPSVSVVMPVYNEAHVVQSAVDSILRQTLRDFEFVIVDNGSVDASPEILRRIRDPRVRVYRNARNLGSAAAANRAVRESTGALIARMDAGDIAAPNRLERQLAAFAEDPRLALVGSRVQAFGERGRPLLRTVTLLPTTPTGIRWHSMFGSPFVHSTTMFTRKSYEAAGGYDERMPRSSDFALFSRIQERYRAINLPDVLVRYRGLRRARMTSDAYFSLVREVIARNARRALDASSADSRLARLISEWPDYCVMLRGGEFAAAAARGEGLVTFLSAFGARFRELYRDPAGEREIAEGEKFLLCRSAWDAARLRRPCAMRLVRESFLRAPLFGSAFLVRQLADGAIERGMRATAGRAAPAPAKRCAADPATCEDRLTPSSSYLRSARRAPSGS